MLAISIVIVCGVADDMPPPAIDTILYTAEEIQARVRAMARAIDADHQTDDPLHVVGVLKGSFVFAADLIRAMRTPLTLDFIVIASYLDGATSSGEIQLLKDLDSAIEGRPVLIVEDIVDTGRTLHYLHAVLRARAPSSLKTACLLSKPTRRAVDAPVDYVGFEIDDRFIVGYGLDHAERFRHLPHIAVIEPPAPPPR